MVHITDVKKITLMEQVADEYEKSVFQEVTYQTLIGQQYTMTRINPLNQLHRIQQKTLQLQPHPQRLRDCQVVALDPK